MDITELCGLLDRGRGAITNQVAYLRKRGWTFARVRDDR